MHAWAQERVDELGDEVWQGVKNKYWRFPVYMLPVCTWQQQPQQEPQQEPQQQAQAAPSVVEQPPAS